MNDEDMYDAYETVECDECDTQVMLIDLVGTKIIDGKSVLADAVGYLGNCPTCLSQIFVEDIT